MKNTLLVIACAALLTVGAAPRRQAAGAAVPITGLLTFSGKGTDGRTFSINQQVTLTVTDAAPVPVPVPQPGGVTITSVVKASGAVITSAAGGEIVFIKGSGFGAGGVVKLAGQAAAVLDWQPFTISVKLPAVTTSQAGSVMVAPAGLTPANSAFSFTIVGAAPVPVPVPVPTPAGLRQWPADSGVLWKRNVAGYWLPYQPPYPWALPSKAGIPYPHPRVPPWSVERAP